MAMAKKLSGKKRAHGVDGQQKLQRIFLIDFGISEIFLKLEILFD